ncbi:uncharacterized protein [Onthophagus taurus]|uniref:uncharacterized protein n=1 Tax=Onthophagus taurus TaxID=166361 RepID=UPI000C208CD9|nr:uncharacterized protein LOC111429386 [Onthophagus taurus]
MAVKFDRWTFLKLLELIFVVSCLICKRVTDDETSRLFLYLQKLSREWSLLTSVTWDKIGSSVADATYGGFSIVTTALFIGKLVGELPNGRRITEIILLLVGTVLFIVLGALELAALENLPKDLVDNAAVLGSLSLATAFLFLLDLTGPKGNKKASLKDHKSHNTDQKPDIFVVETAKIGHIPKLEAEKIIIPSEKRPNGFKNGQISFKKASKAPQKFDIYGKDYESGSEEDLKEILEESSPVWSKIRRGQYVVPTFFYPKNGQNSPERPPSTPGDPGYVQYTARKWGEGRETPKTPRQSPTEV